MCYLKGSEGAYSFVSELQQMAQAATNPWFQFSAVSAEKVVEINIQGYIGWEVDDVSFKKDWEEALAQGMTQARILINSAGGSVFTGFAIYQLIKQSSIKTVGVVQGLAASMASVILMACDERLSGEFGKIMIHQATGWVSGREQEIRSYCELLKDLNNDLLSAYVMATGQSEETVKGWLPESGDTWFNCTRALEAGLLTGKLPSNKLPIEDYQGALVVEACLQHYQNQLAACGCQSIQSSNSMKETSEEKHTKPVLHQAIGESLGLGLEASIDDAQKAIEQLRTQIAEMQNEKVEAIISTSIAQGKITKENEDSFRTLLKADFATTKKAIDAIPVFHDRLKEGVDGQSSFRLYEHVDARKEESSKEEAVHSIASQMIAIKQKTQNK